MDEDFSTRGGGRRGSIRVRLVVKAPRRVSACVYRPQLSGSPAFPFFFLPAVPRGRVRNAFKTTQTPPSSPRPIESSSAPLLVHRIHIQTHLAFPLSCSHVHVYNIVLFHTLGEQIPLGRVAIVSPTADLPIVNLYVINPLASPRKQQRLRPLTRNRSIYVHLM